MVACSYTDCMSSELVACSYTDCMSSERSLGLKFYSRPGGGVALDYCKFDQNCSFCVTSMKIGMHLNYPKINNFRSMTTFLACPVYHGNCFKLKTYDMHSISTFVVLVSSKQVLLLERAYNSGLETLLHFQFVQLVCR